MKGMEKIGAWSFIAGLVIALIAALVWGVTGTVVWVLGVLGVIVGLVNVSDKEVMPFLVAAVALILGTSSLNVVIAAVGFGAGALSDFLQAITLFVAPGAFVVAVKSIFDISKSK